MKNFYDIMYLPWEILPVSTYITSNHIYFTGADFCLSDCYSSLNGVLLHISYMQGSNVKIFQNQSYMF